MINVLKWFKVNSMKAYPKKFQFKIPGKSTRQTIILNINNIKIREFQNVELLSFTIDNRLTLKITLTSYAVELIINFIY